MRISRAVVGGAVLATLPTAVPALQLELEDVELSTATRSSSSSRSKSSRSSSSHFHLAGGGDSDGAGYPPGPQARSNQTDVDEFTGWLSASGTKRAKHLYTDAKMYTAEVETLKKDLGPNSALDSRHPIWKGEWTHLRYGRVYCCCVVLFIAGILCAAGGLGGGTIYASLLMCAGSLSTHDAVPLSKAVIFFGTLSSLALNLKKPCMVSRPFIRSVSMIDWNIVRVVVPSSLLGTYMGVALNRVLENWLIILVLTVLLITICGMVALTTGTQYAEELRLEQEQQMEKAVKGVVAIERAATKTPLLAPALLPAGCPGGSGASSAAGSSAASAPSSEALSTEEIVRQAQEIAKKARRVSFADHVELLTWSKGCPITPRSLRNDITKVDVLSAFAMMLVVIWFGIFRTHADRCELALLSDTVLDSAFYRVQRECHHPSLWYLFDGLEFLMESPFNAAFARVIAIVIPAMVCFFVAFFYSRRLVVDEKWSLGGTLTYVFVALCTGCLAGLVGIGGGVVFSPFFILAGVDPAVAVATSSTCVIFTTCSTTLQYILTDRIILGLAVLYGTVNLVASFIGTRLVHWLQDRYAAKRSYISAIVFLGVFVSTVFAIVKFVQDFRSPGIPLEADAH